MIDRFKLRSKKTLFIDKTIYRPHSFLLPNGKVDWKWEVRHGPGMKMASHCILPARRSIFMNHHTINLTARMTSHSHHPNYLSWHTPEGLASEQGRREYAEWLDVDMARFVPLVSSSPSRPCIRASSPHNTTLHHTFPRQQKSGLFKSGHIGQSPVSSVRPSQFSSKRRQHLRGSER